MNKMNSFLYFQMIKYDNYSIKINKIISKSKSHQNPLKQKNCIFSLSLPPCSSPAAPLPAPLALDTPLKSPLGRVDII